MISKILKITKAAMKAEKVSLQKSKAMNWPINSSKTINPGSFSFIVFNVKWIIKKDKKVIITSRIIKLIWEINLLKTQNIGNVIKDAIDPGNFDK